MAAGSSNLRRNVLFAGTPAAVVVIAVVTLLAYRSTVAEVERSAAARLTATGERAAELVTQFLEERRDDLRLLARTPALVNAARAANVRSRAQGLDQLSIEALEARFNQTKTMGGDSSVLDLLLYLRDQSDFAEIFFTEANGFNVLSTNLTSDFVQSDEEWWTRTVQDGEFQGRPEFDESANLVALEFDVTITDPTDGALLGVLKAGLQLSRIGQLLSSGGEDFVNLQVIDSTGQIIVSEIALELLELTDGAGELELLSEPHVVTRRNRSGSDEIVITVPTEDRLWWVVTRQSTATANASASVITSSLVATGGILFVLTIAVLLMLTTWLDRKVTTPVRAAGAVAQRVADGDLAIQVNSQESEGSDEVGQLLTSIGRMVSALRTLVGAIRGSAEESAAMAEQISASTQEMSASAQEMATTCQYLTDQASEQAAIIRRTAGDADRILDIATNLAEGTSRSAERNSELQNIADNHRKRLIESSEKLSQLANETERGAEEAESLAAMSEQIRDFVTQARGIAEQTNMLSLNAAIEASRAEGGEGRGFGVVADEVRKLAGQAARSASTTSETIGRVLQTVDNTRARLQRIAAGSAAIREIAQSAANGLQEVSEAAAAQNQWTDDISASADQAKELVAEITDRMRRLAEGTESFLSAAEQIAATAQQQTASSEEIASSAGQLAEVSERLTANVSTFRLLGRTGDAAD